MKLKLLLLLLIVTGVQVVAQPGWNWPADETQKSKAEEKNVLYNDARKMGNNVDAANHLQWLLDNTPDLNPSLYINGVKIYKDLEENATGEEQKGYQQTVMDLYDARIANFGDEGSVLNFKAYDAYKFYKGDKAKYQWLYDVFERTYEVNGNEVGSQNLVAYMDVIRRHKLTGGAITDEQVLDKYSNVMSIIEAKIGAGENAGKMGKIKDFVDKMLTSMVDVNCDFIVNTLGPKLGENPEDITMAKKIMGLSLNEGCTDSDIFLEATMVVQEKEPSYGTAKVIGAKKAASGDLDAAETFYKQALSLAETNEKKGDILYELARMDMQRGRKASARSYFYQSVEADATKTHAFKLIGDLYMTSYDECKKNQSKVEDRAIFIAAYNMYRRAGDARSMANAEAQFPSIEELFTENYKEGDAFKIGCWVNESVSLQRRPES